MTEAGNTANEARLRDYLKRATSDLDKAQRRLGQVEARAREPIAILGMACRYPGGVNSSTDLIVHSSLAVTSVAWRKC